MDASAFMTRFDVERSGLMRVVQTGLLSGEQEEDEIRAELYKLNVYGKHHVRTANTHYAYRCLVVPHRGRRVLQSSPRHTTRGEYVRVSRRRSPRTA